MTPDKTLPVPVPHADRPAAPSTRPGGHEQLRTVARAGAVVYATTLLATLIGAAVPALAIATRPHPTLLGTTAEAAAILEHNLRLLCLPFILAAFGFARGRLSRLAGDLIVTAIALGNPITVGLALGRDTATLAPYLAGLPVEWAALSLSSAVWLLARRHTLPRRTLLAYAAAVVVLAAIAATLETFASPHRAR